MECGVSNLINEKQSSDVTSKALSIQKVPRESIVKRCPASCFWKVGTVRLRSKEKSGGVSDHSLLENGADFYESRVFMRAIDGLAAGVLIQLHSQPSVCL